MHVCSISEEPFGWFSFHDAARGGGRAERRLPLFRGAVDHLPAGLDAIVAAADLQGRERTRGNTVEPRLLGVALAEHLVERARRAEIPGPDRVGVLLCGDLYTVPTADRRGGSGDVTPVWEAFAALYRWVAGVAGNHDEFPEGADRLRAKAGVHLLDGDERALDGLRLGGVSGIMGKLGKLHRKDPQTFLDVLDGLLAKDVDILCLHESPSGPQSCKGNPAIRELLELAADAYGRAPLVVCGHAYWPRALAELRGGVQVLNVDGRVVVLERA